MLTKLEAEQFFDAVKGRRIRRSNWQKRPYVTPIQFEDHEWMWVNCGPPGTLAKRMKIGNGFNDYPHNGGEFTKWEYYDDAPEQDDLKITVDKAELKCECGHDSVGYINHHSWFCQLFKGEKK